MKNVTNLSSKALDIFHNWIQCNEGLGYNAVVRLDRSGTRVSRQNHSSRTHQYSHFQLEPHLNHDNNYVHSLTIEVITTLFGTLTTHSILDQSSSIPRWPIYLTIASTESMVTIFELTKHWSSGIKLLYVVIGGHNAKPANQCCQYCMSSWMTPKRYCSGFSGHYIDKL